MIHKIQPSSATCATNGLTYFHEQITIQMNADFDVNIHRLDLNKL